SRSDPSPSEHRPNPRASTAYTTGEEFLTSGSRPLKMTQPPATPPITRPVRNDSGPKTHRPQSRSKAAETRSRLEARATKVPEQRRGSQRHDRWGMYWLEC